VFTPAAGLARTSRGERGHARSITDLYSRAGVPGKGIVCQSCKSALSHDRVVSVDGRRQVHRWHVFGCLICLLRWILETWARTSRALVLVIAVSLLVAFGVWLLGVYGAAIGAAVVAVLQVWPRWRRRPEEGR